MSEELLLYMGPGPFNYMRWAAENAEPLLQARIDQVMAAIGAGARPDPKRWPSVEKCFDRLHDADDVVAIMAAQTLYHLRRRNSMALDPSLQERIDTLLSDALHTLM